MESRCNETATLQWPIQGSAPRRSPCTDSLSSCVSLGSVCGLPPVSFPTKVDESETCGARNML